MAAPVGKKLVTVRKNLLPVLSLGWHWRVLGTLGLAATMAHAEPADADKQRRPQVFSGKVELVSTSHEPGAVAQKPARVMPVISTATQVAPPSDPHEPLFRELPHPEVGGAHAAQPTAKMPPEGVMPVVAAAQEGGLPQTGHSRQKAQSSQHIHPVRHGKPQAETARGKQAQREAAAQRRSGVKKTPLARADHAAAHHASAAHGDQAVKAGKKNSAQRATGVLSPKLAQKQKTKAASTRLAGGKALGPAATNRQPGKQQDKHARVPHAKAGVTASARSGKSAEVQHAARADAKRAPLARNRQAGARPSPAQKASAQHVAQARPQRADKHSSTQRPASRATAAKSAVKTAKAPKTAQPAKASTRATKTSRAERADARKVVAPTRLAAAKQPA